ncbi:MAG: hypothetical protein ABIG95_06080, partial [Candidatus Woesearchaeota archaeon]
VGKTIIYYIQYSVWWLATRNYIAAGANTFNKVMALAVWQKILIILALAIVLFILWNRYFRDTRANNMRKARRHHALGEKYHKKGNIEKAEHHYELAQQYREKAQEQW